MATFEDKDPLGRPVWSNRMVRRPSIDEAGHECHSGDTGEFEIINNSDVFQIKIESWNYEPEEISINRDPIIKNDIIVIGKKLDRETKEPIPNTVFSKRFSLPKDVDYNDLKKVYSSSGVVVIEASKSGRK